MKKELIIEVKRKYKKANYTIGALYINGQWICDTLEPRCIDWNKEKKVPGETAIPEGRYLIEMRRSPKFERRMPYLKNVPEFTNIMIHTGNTVKNTQGCIIVGYNTIRGLVLKSRQAFDKIMERIDYALKAKHQIVIVVS